MKDFKLKNSTVLAGKEGDYGAKIAESAEILNQARLALTEAEQARNSIKKEISGEEPILEGESKQAEAAGANPTSFDCNSQSNIPMSFQPNV
jgi:hypothetical protein